MRAPPLCITPCFSYYPCETCGVIQGYMYSPISTPFPDLPSTCIHISCIDMRVNILTYLTTIFKYLLHIVPYFMHGYEGNISKYPHHFICIIYFHTLYIDMSGDISIYSHHLFKYPHGFQISPQNKCIPILSQLFIHGGWCERPPSPNILASIFLSSRTCLTRASASFGIL